MFKKIIAASILSSLVLASSGLAQTRSAPGYPPTAENRRAFEQALIRSGGPYVRAFKEVSPEEYEPFVDRLFVLGSALSSVPKQAPPDLAEAIADFYTGKAADAMNAPAADLAKLNRAQLEFTRALKAGHAKECAVFVTGVGFPLVPASLQPKADHLYRSMMEVAKAGKGRPKDPGRATIGDSSRTAWIQKMEELAPTERVRSLITDDSAQQSASDEEKCQLGETIYAAIADLPLEQATNISAVLVRDMLTPRRP